MFIQKVTLINWRNFRSAEATLQEVTYVLGPNASGKSNFFDALRFLRDIAKPTGGGLQTAVIQRGGIKKIRCLHARSPSYVGISIELGDGQSLQWKYELHFNLPQRGKKLLLIQKEKVIKVEKDGKEKVILDRPNKDDDGDELQLTETYLEQARTNIKFREIASFLSGLTYVHLVPQLLKFGEQIGGINLDDDPFGQSFMERVAKTRKATRAARLRRIDKALKTIIPHMEELEFIKDKDTGHPHLEIRFRHFRPRGAKQREDQFSDGTLRLIALLWLLQEGGDAPLLLEEPELSLNEEIVAEIPQMINSVRRTMKGKKQIIISTHSHALLSNPGIPAEEIIILEPNAEGTSIRSVDDAELAAMESGFSVADVVLPNARRVSKRASSQLSLEI